MDTSLNGHVVFLVDTIEIATPEMHWLKTLPCEAVQICLNLTEFLDFHCDMDS